MAKLEIKVTGLDQLRAPGASSGAAVGADLARQLRVQGQLAERIARSLKSSLDGIGGSLTSQLSNAAREAERVSRAAEAARQQAAAKAQQDAARNAQAQQRIDLQSQRLREQAEAKLRDQALRAVALRQQAEQAAAKQRLAEEELSFRKQEANLRRLERERLRALRERTRQEQESARRTAAIISTAGRSIGSVGRGIGGGISSVGSGIGSGIGGLFSGGLGVSGLVRGAGGLASGVFGGAGRAAAGITGGIGGALSGGLGLIPGIGPLLGGISSGITSAVAGGLQAAASVGSGVLDAATNLATSITSKLVSVIQVGLVAGLVLAVSSVAKASEFQRISGAFDGIAKSIGTDATTALEGFRTATRGTVSDLDLLTQANRAVILGAVSSQEEFEKLATTAIRLGRATGRDAASALEDLTLGIARQSKLILDNLGIIVDSEGAYQRLAVSLGKTTAQLTDAEKRQAFVNEAYAAAERGLARVGPAQADYAETVEQLGAAFSNLQVQIGGALLPILQRVTPELTRIVEGIRQWLTDNNVQIAASLTSALEGIPNALGAVAKFVESNSLADFFTKAKQAAIDFGEILSDVFSGLFDRAAAEARALFIELGAEVNNFTAFLRFDRDEQLERSRGAAASVRNAGRLSQEIAFAEAARKLGEAADRLTAPTASGGGSALGAASTIGRVLRDELTRTLAFGPRSPFGTPGGGSIAGVGLGIGLGGGDPTRPGAGPTPDAIASIPGNLATIGVVLSELPDTAQALFDAIASSNERIEALRQAAEDEIATSLSRTTRAALAAEREKLEGIEDERRERERSNERLVREIDGLTRDFEGAVAEIENELATARARIRSDAAEREASGREQIAGLVEGRVGQLAGAGGGLDGISLPLNVFKAIEDVRRQRSKQVFEGLRQATAGLSSSDLAANDGALLQRVLQGQAERDVNAAGRTSALLASIAEDTTARLRLAESEYVTATDAVTTAYTEALTGAASALEEGAAAFERLSATNAELRERLARVEKQLEAIERLERLARSRP